MADSERRSRVGEWAQLLGVVVLEALLVVALYVSGRYLGPSVSLSHFATWMRDTAPGDAIVPLLRLGGLAVTGWLLFTTLLYVVLALGDPEGAAGRRSRGWLPPGLVRRVVDGVAGASLMVAAMGASAGVSSAAPMPVAVTGHVLPTPVSGSSGAATVGHGRTAGVSAGQSDAVRGVANAAVNASVVGRHLPHPGLVVHKVPAVVEVVSPAPGAPSPENGFAGLPAGTKVVVVQRWDPSSPGSVDDCLSVIAQRHLDDWRLDTKISVLNVGRVQADGSRLQDDNWIQPGWVLIMPPEAHGTLVVGAAPAATPEPAPVPAVAAPAAAPAVSMPPAPSSAAAAVGGSATGTAAPTPAPAQAPGVAATAGSSAPATGGGGGRTGAVQSSNGPTVSGAAPSSPVAPGNGDVAGGRVRRRGPVVPLPVELLGAGVLCAGVVEFLRRRTTVQRMHRRAGRRIPRPSGEQARVELAARVGADDDGAAFVDAGLRYLAVAVRASGMEPPVVLGAELHDDCLVVLLAGEAVEAPEGFEMGSDGLCWVLPRPGDVGALEEAVADVVAPLPLMVTLGHADAGQVTVLVNLEAVGVLSLVGDGVAARQMVAAMALGLATSAWSELASRLYLVGFACPDGLGASPAVRVVDTVEECLAGIRCDAAELAERSEEAGQESAAALRFYGQGGDVGPSLVLCVEPPAPETLAELVDLAGDARHAVAVVVAGDVDYVGDGWRLEVDDDSRVEVGSLGRVVDAEVVPLKMLATIEERIAVATLPGDIDPGEPAEHWYDSVAAMSDADTAAARHEQLAGDDVDDDDRFEPPELVPVGAADQGAPQSAGADDGDDDDRYWWEKGDQPNPSDPFQERPEDELGSLVEDPEAGTGAAEMVEGDVSPDTGIGVAVSAPPTRAAAAEGEVGEKVDGRVAEVEDLGDLRSALAALAVLPIALPDAYRHPEILIQLLRPVPRCLRLGDSGTIEVINADDFPRTRSLEAAVYKALNRHASVRELCAVLAPGKRPTDDVFRVVISGARTTLGKDKAGRDYLSTKREGGGNYDMLDAVVTDWAVFEAVVNGSDRAVGGDIDPETRIQALTAALQLVGDGAPLANVPMGDKDKGWKWTDLPSTNLLGETESAILDVAHWLALLYQQTGDLEAAAWAIAKGRAVCKIDVSLNCDHLELGFATGGLDGLDAAMEEIYSGYRKKADDLDAPVPSEVRDHWLELRVAGGAVQPTRKRKRPAAGAGAGVNGNGNDHGIGNGNGNGNGASEGLRAVR